MSEGFGRRHGWRSAAAGVRGIWTATRGWWGGIFGGGMGVPRLAHGQSGRGCPRAAGCCFGI